MFEKLISLVKEPSTKIGLGLLLSLFVPAPLVEVVNSTVINLVSGGLVLWGTVSREKGGAENGGT